MTTITQPKKAAAVNPLKLSPPLGASLAFLGLKGMIPLFHGSQGCTAFAKVILVRHFREAIPLSTTAMTEVSSILGGEENITTAILTLVEKAKPDVIGLLTTGLTETRGDDMQRILKDFRIQHPELDWLPIISVSTPDYKGAMQDGYAATVEEIVTTYYGAFVESEDIIPNLSSEVKPRVTILAGSLLGPGDVEEVKAIVEAFGLTPVMIPDLSGSMDGHLDDGFNSVTTGGTSLDDLRRLGESTFTLAIGESMRKSADALKQKFGTNYEVFPRLSGLQAMDRFLLRLSKIVHSRQDAHFVQPYEVPEKFNRQRRQLQDAMLDTHFYFGRKRISLAMEPDLLYQTSWLLHEMGAEIQAAVTTTKSPLLENLPIESVTIGDLEDFENLAVGSDLLITNSHGRAIAERLKIPLYRMGYPIFDRFGNGQRCLIGYRGTIQFLMDLGNLFIEAEES
ncbi:nitrogenase iron-molybdenum cofactor biosynthesis protein NifN [Limnoraphis robusta]|uniref:nitrogenase iron-molybdenum cofactor biosynthesis protein NifN n=1 Tax=Limnoraphis robusta TaxID=1118279 RepID=UPI002B1ED45F|nr:nitrogenase iron-molybdenum cofactor biosynthesis protein NifN [Limnoraphis robusta]MEA5495713.1 nitrogenase iron-molybdenum cofactor biosynthesis protein NifN [Limnoraphis robusta BA-68 BA1]